LRRSPTAERPHLRIVRDGHDQVGRDLDWPLETSTADMLARVEARAGVLRRRRQEAVAVPGVFAVALALIVALVPGRIATSRVKTVRPADVVTSDKVEADATSAPCRTVATAGRVRAGAGPVPVPSTTTTAQADHGDDAVPSVSSSPTGLVAFIFNSDVWIANVDGSGRRQLTARRDLVFYTLDWSPDGQRILGEVGTTSATESGFQLAVVDLKGNVRQLTHSTRGGVDSPHWSPDGRHIVYDAPPPSPADAAANAPLVNGGPAVWIADADGSNARMITSGSEPSWLPDGQAVVYFCSGNGAAATCIARLDGTIVRMLPEGPLYPTVSPDGRQVAGLADGFHIVIFNIDGSGGVRELPKAPNDQAAGAPSWSPDGRWIAVIGRHSTETCKNGVCQAGPYYPYLSVEASDGTGTPLIVQGPDIWVSFAPRPA